MAARDDGNSIVGYHGISISALHDNPGFAYFHQGVSLPVKHLCHHLRQKANGTEWKTIGQGAQNIERRESEKLFGVSWEIAIVLVVCGY